MITILFYPENIRYYSALYEHLDALNIKWHNDRKKPYDIIFFWSYTDSIYMQNEFILKSPRVINRGCYDVTKSKVEQIFQSGINVDPETYIGEYIKKSENQSLNHGIIIKCPQPKENGFVYQKIINTKNSKGNFVDYRLFFSGQIDFIVKKEKSDIFNFNHIIDTEIIEPNLLFTEEQIKYIIEKCRLFGMDFGELDVLIDEEKNIYVIDVNNVAGRGAGYTYFQNSKEIITRYKKAFFNFLIKEMYKKNTA